MFQGFRALCAGGMICVVGAGAAHAQTVVRSHFGSASGDLFGTSVAAAGDVNGDGVVDYLVGAAEDGSVFMEREGYVRVYSGADGTLIRTHDGESIFQRFGIAVAGVGNTNPGVDTADDYAVGATYDGTGGQGTRGKLYVYSGATGALRWSVLGDAAGDELGTSVAGGHDVNGDGVADVIVGAPRGDANGSSSGYARVLSGVDGSQIHRVDGASGNQRWGTSVCIPGQLNPVADSRADFVVGSYNGVKAYSGANGSVLYSLSGLSSNDLYGISVAALGDVTGDGVPEIIVGASQGNFLFLGPGYVEVRNGATGALVFRETGDFDGQNYGRYVANAGDWNADGFDDVLVAGVVTDGATNIEVDVLSGLDGTWLGTLANGLPEDREGGAIAGIGDSDGDGKTEIVLGASTASDAAFQAGRAVVYESTNAVSTGCTGGTTVYCTSLPNSTGDTATLSLVGSTSVGDNNVVFVSTDLPANQPGVFYYGDGTMNTPFGNGIRCVGGSALARLGPTSTGPAGIAAKQLNLGTIIDPHVQIAGDSTWYFQFWFRDPSAGGVNFSDGLQIDFCD